MSAEPLTDFFIWGEIERLRKSGFGFDAEIHSESKLQAVFARIGIPGKGVLLIHASVEKFLLDHRQEWGNETCRWFLKLFRDGWEWQELDTGWMRIVDHRLRPHEYNRVMAKTRLYPKIKAEVSAARSEAGKKGAESRWGDQKSA